MLCTNAQEILKNYKDDSSMKDFFKYSLKNKKTENDDELIYAIVPSAVLSHIRRYKRELWLNDDELLIIENNVIKMRKYVLFDFDLYFQDWKAKQELKQMQEAKKKKRVGRPRKECKNGN